MKTTMVSMSGVLLVSAVLGCGAAPDDARQDEQGASSLVMNTVAVKQADGTYKKSTYYLTREQRKAEVHARYERDRLRHAGVQALTSEVGPESCSNGDALWLYSQANPSWYDPACCVIGEGNDYVDNMCSFQFAKALWGGISDGLYGHVLSYCGSYYGHGEQVPYPDCPDIEWVQLDQ